MADWEIAPEDAQFYSLGSFKKHHGSREFFWDKNRNRWLQTSYATMEWHKSHSTFEMRPDPAVSDKPSPVDAVKWNGEGLPPAGTVCECTFFDVDRYFKVKVLDAERNGRKAVVTLDAFGNFSQVLWGYDFRPIKSDSEKWLESAMDCVVLDDKCTAEDVIGMIHSAIVSGKLPTPKVKNNE